MLIQNRLGALACYPTVFAVGNEYQIFTLFEKQAIVSAQIGNAVYFDDDNGILRSGSKVHKIHVPMKELNEHKTYTIVYRIMTDRKPYFPESEDEQRIEFQFHPVNNGEKNIYLLSDAHNLEFEPIQAGSYFGDKLDLLVLNGDIPNHSGDIENFNSIYRIAGAITKGACACVFARGNHDTRGIHAEDFSQYTPVCYGRTYYTFRLADLWGLVLDCGEDKDDDCDEYGHTVCFHNFRQKETQYIESLVRNAQNEYEADGVNNRIVICHIPFTKEFKPPFNIEKELYSHWCKVLRDNIKPQLLLFGHQHCARFCPVGDDWDQLGQPCPAVVAGWPIRGKDEEPNKYSGAAIVMNERTAHIIFNTNEKEVLGEFFTEI